MKCLLVIDMQEDYVGNSRNMRRYPYKGKEFIIMSKNMERFSQFEFEEVSI
ncbi:hypothetical protein [Clostridium saccharoperbutylacetonicum]|uniref:hypothetical protein n=1 Tax=Clostridium saccharoperbutylacetonicum TaxID=36745 RepID=UPI0039E9F054